MLKGLGLFFLSSIFFISSKLAFAASGGGELINLQLILSFPANFL